MTPEKRALQFCDVMELLETMSCLVYNLPIEWKERDTAAKHVKSQVHVRNVKTLANHVFFQVTSETVGFLRVRTWKTGNSQKFTSWRILEKLRTHFDLGQHGRNPASPGVTAGLSAVQVGSTSIVAPVVGGCVGGAGGLVLLLLLLLCC